LHELGHKTWDTVQLSLNVAILNQDVFSLSITEIAQPVPKCLDPRPGSVGIPTYCEESYSRDFRRLLRVGEVERRRNQEGQSEKHDAALHSDLTKPSGTIHILVLDSGSYRKLPC
jgi:hypothetical protein